MAAPAIGVRPRFAPVSLPKIDWSHPLAQGLDTCVLPGVSFRDLVTGLLATTPPTPGVWEHTKWGRGYQFTNDVAGRIEWTSAQKPMVEPPFSALAVGNMPFQSGAGLISYGGSTASGKGWSLIANAAGNARFQLGGVASYDVNGILPSSFLMPLHYGVTLPANGGTATFFVDGRQAGSVSVGTVGTPASTGLILGAIHTGSAYVGAFFRGMTAAMVWRRVLTAAEWAMLGADPFCFLRY